MVDQNLSKIKYLTCVSKYRVSKKTLANLRELSVKNRVLTSEQKPLIILDGDELNELLIRNELLISVGRSVMHKVFDCFTDKTKLIVLCDTMGYVIDLLSSTEILQWCFKKGIMLGACLDYYSFGINSISIAIHDNSPTIIIGDEHYCDIIKGLSCIAAPIKIEGKTIGFIDITSDVGSNLVQLMALVELMAELIEIRINNINFEHRLESCEKDDKHPVKLFPHDSAYDKVWFFGTLLVESNIDFTIREVEILYRLFKGKLHNDIIHELNISKSTIKTHLRNIYQKLGVNNIGDCIRITKNILALNSENTVNY